MTLLHTLCRYVDMKICRRKLHTYEPFYDNRGRTYCPECRKTSLYAYAKSHPEQVKNTRRKHRLKQLFNITLDEYNQLLAKQNNLCAICRKPETCKRNGKIKRLAIDHSHSKGHNRGLLCQRCNQGIGLMGESIDVFINAVGYLLLHE